MHKPGRMATWRPARPRLGADRLRRLRGSGRRRPEIAARIGRSRGWGRIRLCAVAGASGRKVVRKAQPRPSDRQHQDNHRRLHRPVSSLHENRPGKRNRPKRASQVSLELQEVLSNQGGRPPRNSRNLRSQMTDRARIIASLSHRLQQRFYAAADRLRRGGAGRSRADRHCGRQPRAGPRRFGQPTPGFLLPSGR